MADIMRSKGVVTNVSAVGPEQVQFHVSDRRVNEAGQTINETQIGHFTVPNANAPRVNDHVEVIVRPATG